MTALSQMLADLRLHQALSRDLLALVERESHALRHGETDRLQDATEARQQMLPRLTQSLETLRAHRQRWQSLSAAERAAQPEVAFLIRQTQDLIMRAIHLDRENEQGFLRRGLIPARDLPAAQQQRPHFVADLYRRQGSQA